MKMLVGFRQRCLCYPPPIPRVSSSHANPLAVKTNAPNGVFWDIFRCWIKEHPLTSKKIEKDVSRGKERPSPNAMARVRQRCGCLPPFPSRTPLLPPPFFFLQSYLSKLLAKEPQLEANFTRVPEAINQAKTDGVTRCGSMVS